MREPLSLSDTTRGRIRLLYITHNLAIGGLQQVVVNLCKAIDQDRFHVGVLCLRALGPLAEEIERLGISVSLLEQKATGTDYFSFLKVTRFLERHNIHVIHTHNTQPLIDGTLAALISSGRPGIVHTEHGRRFPDKRRYMLAEWLVSHFTFAFIAVSDDTASQLRRFERIPSKKLGTIENGIDGSRFEITIDQQEKRRELGLPATGPVIGAISRLEEVKGITYLLQAMVAILRAHADLTLLVVGDGSQRSQLERECQQLGIRRRVIFSGARLDIPDILQVLDIYLLPSLSEGLPLGLLEAMAAGCPIIASNVGGIPSVVDHRSTALLVPPEEPREIAAAVLSLLADKHLRYSMILNARTLFRHRFSAAAMTQKYSDLYEESIRRKGSGSTRKSGLE